MSREDTLADQLKLDYRKADLTPRERAMLDFVHKLTSTPSAMRESDTQSLRDAGFADLAILHIVMLASFFNYINRVADALGVELDDGVWEHMAGHPEVPWQTESGSGAPRHEDGRQDGREAAGG